MLHVPYIAIAAAFALIYVPRFVVWREMARLEGGYDNNEPRVQQARLEGRGRRALAAHHNAFEAFAPFAAGVLAAIQRGVRTDVVAYVCIAFVAVRTLYVAAYLADKANVRSTMWALGVAAIVSLMMLAIIG